MQKRPSWRVMLFWMRKPFYMSVIFSAIVLAMLFLDSTFVMWQGIVSGNSGLVKTVVAGVCGAIIIPSLAWNFLKWATTIHSITERQFILTKGVFSKRTYVVNYEQIQNINVVRSFLERVLMLSKLRIETAGSRPGESELEIEGLSASEAERVVREITHLVDESKRRGKDEPAHGGDEDYGQLLRYSRRILAELKEIRGVLSEQKRKKDWGERV